MGYYCNNLERAIGHFVTHSKVQADFKIYISLSLRLF